MIKSLRYKGISYSFIKSFTLIKENKKYNRAIIKYSEGMAKYNWVLVILLLISFATATWGQVAVMPTDDFYTDALGWELKRYTRNLPVTTPYQVKTIKRILLDVIDNGDTRARARAQYYLDKYFPVTRSFRDDTDKSITESIEGIKKDDDTGEENKENNNDTITSSAPNIIETARVPIHVFNEFNVNIRVKKVDSGGDDNTKIYEHKELYNGKIAFGADWAPNNFLGLSCNLGFVVRSNEIDKLDALPKFVFNNDTDVILPMKETSGDADFLLNPNIIFTWGDERMWGTFGINRAGYGLFLDDSVILNPFAYQSINSSFNYTCKVFSYSQTFGMLAATKNSDSDKFRLGKFMSFHTTKFHLPSRWSISLYESAIFHKPFNPAYLLPIPWFIVSNVSGFNDNVMSGINFEWRPGCVALSLDLLLDDFDFKPLLKLKLNDAAVRTAFKAGFVYSPPDSPCEYIAVSYTLVTPYTYTKFNEQNKRYRYLDYTNFGQSMGSDLPPNSDSIGLTISWRVFEHLRLKVATSFARHGNPYEDLDSDDVIEMSKKRYDSTGLLSSDTKGLDSAEGVTGFLKQRDIMYIMQASIFAEWEQIFKTKRTKTNAGSMSLQFQYTFEYINKDGVDTPIFSGIYRSKDDVDSAIDSWRGALHDSYNNYFTVGLKYFF